MDNSIEIKYNGLKNTTYECLKRGIIYADIGFDRSDMVMDIVPARHYEGKTPNGEAKIGFIISIKCYGAHPELQEKIVFDFDGERLEVEACQEHIFKSSYKTFAEECTYSLEEIIGINRYRMNGSPFFAKMLFDLQPKDIKRIAEAKNVCIYYDSNGEYLVNGGNITLRNGHGSCQIEGIQGVMKRAFHYFVDVTSYIDYCSSFLETREKALNTEKQKIKMKEQEQEQLRIQQELEEQEAIAHWRKSRNRTLIILVVSIVLFVLCEGFLIDTDNSIYPWLFWLAMGGTLYSILKRAMLYNIGSYDGSDGNGE